MPAHRIALALAVSLLPFLLGSAQAQQGGYPPQYPPSREDAYRPPARDQGPTYYPDRPPQGGGPYSPGPSEPYRGPGQPYDAGPPERYSGPQSRYEEPRPYRDERRDDDTYSSKEIIAAGHGFFGTVTQGLAKVIEFAFQSQGRPNGYILGQDAGAAFVAGLRYGEGTLYTKDAGTHRVYWQGPSIGYDAGGDGSKVMVLVYNLRDPEDIYRRFGGVDGSAYVVGGVGMTVQKNGDVVTALIRTGVGLRLGANVGYLKYTRAPTWNPF